MSDQGIKQVKQAHERATQRVHQFTRQLEEHGQSEIAGFFAGLWDYLQPAFHTDKTPDTALKLFSQIIHDLAHTDPSAYIAGQITETAGSFKPGKNSAPGVSNYFQFLTNDPEKPLRPVSPEKIGAQLHQQLGNRPVSTLDMEVLLAAAAHLPAAPVEKSYAAETEQESKPPAPRTGAPDLWEGRTRQQELERRIGEKMGEHNGKNNGPVSESGPTPSPKLPEGHAAGSPGKFSGEDAAQFGAVMHWSIEMREHGMITSNKGTIDPKTAFGEAFTMQRIWGPSFHWNDVRGKDFTGDMNLTHNILITAEGGHQYIVDMADIPDDLLSRIPDTRPGAPAPQPPENPQYELVENTQPPAAGTPFS